MANVNQITDLFDHTTAWDWETKHVSQSFVDAQGNYQNTSVADIIDSGTVLLAAGPADLDLALQNTGGGSTNGGIRIVPVGLIESASVQQSRQLSTIFELGSKLRYIVPGRTIGAMMINRVLFDGDNLLKVLYGGEVYKDYADTKNKFVKFVSDPIRTPGSTMPTRKFANIGSGHIAMNLASAFFNQPFGIAMYFKDQQNDLISEIYFEGCHVSAHSFGISAGANVLAESVNIEYVRVRPIITAGTLDGTIDQLTDSDIVGGWSEAA